ncbi:MAG: NADH-quinone oxidoreductase subunit J [Pirellulaceae bacterium]
MINLLAANWGDFYFILFAGIACIFAVAVLLTSNIVRMAFYLIISLGATAGLFFLAGAEFVGAMQLMIYVGGTLVLLIFGVMLTAQSRFISMKTHPRDWLLAVIVGGSLLMLLLTAAFRVPDWHNEKHVQAAVSQLEMADSKTATPLGLALTGVRVDKIDQADEQLKEGMSGYLLPFVIVSIHLLVVLIGAAYMARAKRGVRVSQEEETEEEEADPEQDE